MLKISSKHHILSTSEQLFSVVLQLRSVRILSSLCRTVPMIGFFRGVRLWCVSFLLHYVSEGAVMVFLVSF